MIDPKILKKVRRLEIKTRHIIQNSLAGSYHSRFKGQGINFAGVRSYTHGDDFRRIDWNVSARSNQTQIKEFEEERDLTVMILVDISASQNFGTCEQIKRDAAAEIAAACGFSALSNNDRVGILLFSDQVESYIPPKKGKKQMYRCLRDIFSTTAKHQKTNISLALEKCAKVLHKRSVIFLVSDFQDYHYEKQLLMLSKKHHLIPIVVEDPSENKLPQVGLLELEDPETGKRLVINSSDPATQEKFNSIQTIIKAEHKRAFRKAGLTPIHVNLENPIIDPILHYFNSIKGS